MKKNILIMALLLQQVAFAGDIKLHTCMDESTATFVVSVLVDELTEKYTLAKYMDLGDISDDVVVPYDKYAVSYIELSEEAMPEDVAIIFYASDENRKPVAKLSLGYNEDNSGVVAGTFVFTDELGNQKKYTNLTCSAN